jgi:CHRD domain-containing protein
MRVGRMLTMFAAAALIGGACSDDTTGIPAGLEVFTATLSGANEKPTAVTTAATGTALVTVLGNLVSWKVDVVNIDSIVAGHIHRGPADSAGPVRVNFNPPVTGQNFTGTATVGSATVADSILVLMRAGNTYVNIHTQVNGAGEIRGQLRKL